MKLRFNKEHKNTFNAIRDCIKNIETRAATVKYKNISEGDVLIFVCEKDSFQRKVKRVTHFTSIDSMLKVYTPKEINPKLSSKEELVAMYKSFPSYEEKIVQYGIFALELENI